MVIVMLAVASSQCWEAGLFAHAVGKCKQKVCCKRLLWPTGNAPQLAHSYPAAEQTMWSSLLADYT